MKYVRYRLFFENETSNGVGLDEVREPRQDNLIFIGISPDDPREAWLYGCVDDSFEVAPYAKWSMEEVSVEAALAFARNGNPECYLDDNGVITSPPRFQ